MNTAPSTGPPRASTSPERSFERDISAGRLKPARSSEQQAPTDMAVGVMTISMTGRALRVLTFVPLWGTSLIRFSRRGVREACCRRESAPDRSTCRPHSEPGALADERGAHDTSPGLPGPMRIRRHRDPCPAAGRRRTCCAPRRGKPVAANSTTYAKTARRYCGAQETAGEPKRLWGGRGWVRERGRGRRAGNAPPRQCAAP